MKISTAFLALFTLGINVFAQDPSTAITTKKLPDSQTSAPVFWTRYKIATEDISIELPKMPVRIDSEDACRQEKSSVFHAYAENAVYEFRFVVKRREKVPDFCPKSSGFGPENMTARLNALRQTSPGTETAERVNFKEAKLFTWETDDKTTSRWLVTDPDDNSWVEVAVIRRNDVEGNEAKFLNSLQFTSASGTEIGKGADVTIGDVGLATQAGLDAGKDKAIDNALSIVSTPRAKYTEAARRASNQGSVQVRVTLLANGGVGMVQVVKGLENGLNEQAVEAARKLVFLPKRVNGIPVTVVKTMEYSFSIY